MEQWNNPGQVNELRMRLEELKCENVTEFAQKYQEIESQIPVDAMSPGDRIYKFLTR